MSIVNINVSVLYSSEGGEAPSQSNRENSKQDNQLDTPQNTYSNTEAYHEQRHDTPLENTGEIADHSETLTYSPDSKKKVSASISKNSKNSSSKQSKTSQANLNNLITNNLSNTHNSSSNKSKDSENTITIKNVINKRKQLVLKQVKQGDIENLATKNMYNKNLTQNKIPNNNSSDEFYDIGTNQGLNTSEHLKITNITNIIVGPKSFDIKNIKNPRNEKMLRDIKALSFITQKALTSQCKANPVDSIDDERRSFCNFQNKNEFYIDDNSDLPSGIGKSTPLKSETENRIINIININNNYNIGNLNMQSISERDKSFGSNYYSITGSSQQISKTNKSFKTLNIKDYKKNISQLIKENLSKITSPVEDVDNSPMNTNSNISNKVVKKLIPRHSNTSSRESFFTNSRQSYNNFKPDSLKEIMKSVKKENKKEKFVALNGFRK